MEIKKDITHAINAPSTVVLVLSSLRSLAVFKQFEGAREASLSRDKERQSREEPGRETASPLVFAASPLCVFAFKLLKPPSYAG